MPEWSLVSALRIGSQNYRLWGCLIVNVGATSGRPRACNARPYDYFVGVGVPDDPSANLFAAYAARAVEDASPYIIHVTARQTGICQDHSHKQSPAKTGGRLTPY